MVVVSIVAVLMAIAGPSFADLIASQRAGAVASDLDAALSLTRGEATKRNANMWLCPTTASATGWKDGWRIQGVACGTVGTTSEAHGAITGTTINGPTSVVFQSSGRVQGATAPAFTITTVGLLASVTKYVCVDLSGRPRVSTAACS
jgi:type IV fimbrial biogenesis protein FimT